MRGISNKMAGLPPKPKLEALVEQCKKLGDYQLQGVNEHGGKNCYCTLLIHEREIPYCQHAVDWVYIKKGKLNTLVSYIRCMRSPAYPQMEPGWKRKEKKI